MSELFQRAEEMFRVQDLAGCIGLCHELLASEPDRRDAAHLLGVALQRSGEGDKATALLLRTLTASPDDLVLRMDCALAIVAGGEIERGISLLAEGASHHPGNPDLAARLARLLSDHARHAEAQLVLNTALRLRPDHLELRGLLAAELAADQAADAALTQMRILQIILPGQSPLYANEGVLRQSLGDLAGAVRAYRRAVTIDAGNAVAQVNLGTALMTQGDYSAGFAHYEFRLGLPDMRLPPAGLPRWRGEDLRGKRLLVSAEQGFGDMLQFIRFLPLLSGLGAEIWLDCPKEMARLFAAQPGLAGIVGSGDRLPHFDFATPLLSLPLLMRSGDNLMSGGIPYLRPPAAGPVLPPAPRRKIGLIWRGRPAKGELFVRRTLARRSCSLAELAPLWQREDFNWYSLQIDAEPEELAGTGIIDLAPLLGDFADSAYIMAQLDLVISIDTAAAHLAAAMSRPLWLLLAPGQCDYRWNGVAGGSPWYPAIRLFRADRRGFSALAADAAGQLDDSIP